MAEASATFAVSASLEHARESFGTYQRAQERAVAYTVLAHKSILQRCVPSANRTGAKI